MSRSTRKLGFYCLEFKYKRREAFFFDKTAFMSLLEHILSLELEEQLIPKGENSMAALESYEEYSVQNDDFIKIIFKSCKFNHSPDYMSSVDGSERESNKGLHEGEKERTHLLCKIEREEVRCILEERRSGVSISSIVKYLNSHLDECLKREEVSPKYKVVYSVVTLDDFERALSNLARICAADIYTHKQLLGTDGMNIMDRADINMKNELVIKCSVVRGESLGTRTLKRAYGLIGAGGGQISRIRVYGKDDNQVNVLLDSDIIRRVESINVDIDEDKGVVDSHSVFAKMEEIFGVDE